MPTDTPAPQPDPPCEKCGEGVQLLSFIPRFGQQPPYRIFECTACQALTWIAEKVTGSHE
jgi:hypothetical protein